MPARARQYTIRNVPEYVDRCLRKKVRETGKSFNQIALDALAAGAGEKSMPQRDLREIAGSLSKPEADRMDDEIRRQRQVDPELWR